MYFVLFAIATRVKSRLRETREKAGAPAKIHCMHRSQSIVSNKPPAKKHVPRSLIPAGIPASTSESGLLAAKPGIALAAMLGADRLSERQWPVAITLPGRLYPRENTADRPRGG
jgi:hypothetical protein